ncbi:HNH endonuclease [Kitasatospora sp. NPDC088548]|uniref:HNH endonuclease n=1 Tax=Kitasatospora sp. NPDC088548 TaxID=3364075 RepID=UPI00382DC66C
MRRRSRNTGPTTSMRALVYQRDGHRCVRCGTSQSLTIQHRTNRAMGGSTDPAINQAPNLLTACQQCNMHFEAQPAEAYANGWKVRRPANPAHIPVLYVGGELRSLEPDGTSRDLGRPKLRALVAAGAVQ